jgi:hypothetical protein
MGWRRNPKADFAMMGANGEFRQILLCSDDDSEREHRAGRRLRLISCRTIP